MKGLFKFFVCAVLLVCSASLSFAQCGAHVLAAVNENAMDQTYDVSVWTTSPYCPASGSISLQTIPPGSAGFGPSGDPYWVDSFFDVFTEVETVRPPVVPLLPPGSPPFQILTELTFNDPVYPPLTYVETVFVNPLGRLEIFRATICTDNVPPLLVLGQSFCFTVCHKVYTIPLYTNPGDGKPIIRVSPGCMGPPLDNCLPNPCMPGGLNDFRYDVYERAGQWYLEFEYSNPMREPVCYCVSYTGNLPFGGKTYVLGGWENERQTWDVSVWQNNLAFPVNGMIELFSYPEGAQIGGGGGGGAYVQSFFDVFLEAYTIQPPVGRGIFTPGQQFQLIGYVHFEPPGPVYPPMWVVEDVVVTPTGGLQLLNPTCPGPVVIPPIINPGIPECLIVCHDVYHIPLNCDAASTPTVNIFSGCGPLTPCNNPIPCNPGAMTDFRYEVYRVGGTWMLEFEYSNEMNQPVCYCVDVACPPTPTPTAFALGAIHGPSQAFNVSVWGSSPDVPLQGRIHYRSEPPGAMFAWHIDSFFDVFLEPFTAEVPVSPGIYTPGQVFQLVAEIDFFGPGSDPFEGQVCYENVIVNPMGQIELWDPNSPCTGDVVPPSMFPGQSMCFRVCHRIYEVVLDGPAGIGRPIINVTPGCYGPPNDNCVPQACIPGGPNDYVYDVYDNGVSWILRFEYSNAYIEPVCYCVTYAGNQPPGETHELVAIDETYSTFDVTTWATGLTDPFDSMTGQITVYSYPVGAYVGPYMGFFAGVGEEWHTIEVPVGPGTFTPGEVFQLIAYYDYLTPDFPDVWKTEWIQVRADGQLALWDQGGECTGDMVPSMMNPGQSECFHVCHRIYHIALNAFDPANPPSVIVQPGCYGPPQDHCLPDISCVPGGLYDYRFALIWRMGYWELEFEYSNPYREPVCYCVTIVPPPCLPVIDLVIQWPDTVTNNVRIAWTCPQWGQYIIYSTNVRNNDGNPPGPGWVVEDHVMGNAGEQKIWQPLTGTDELYRNYVVKCDCNPPIDH